MAFRAVLFILAFLLLVHSEVEAKSKKANSTAVLCVFRKMEKCYNIMPAMGGNMSLRFAQSPAELSGNCMQLEPFKTCLKNPCGQKVNLDKTLADISNLATNLCDLGKLGGSFINASRDCYNQNFTEIQKCIARYDTKEKNDIKALCKANKETVKCVKSVIGRCKNGTAVLKNVITTFNSYAPLLCGAYGLHPTSLWILAMLYIIVASFALH